MGFPPFRKNSKHRKLVLSVYHVSNKNFKLSTDTEEIPIIHTLRQEEDKLENYLGKEKEEILNTYILNINPSINSLEGIPVG